MLGEGRGSAFAGGVQDQKRKAVAKDVGQRRTAVRRNDENRTLMGHGMQTGKMIVCNEG
jgi:hypothetical protein